MSDKPDNASTPHPPDALDRFTRALLVVPASEIAEQKAIYEHPRQEWPGPAPKRRGSRRTERAAGDFRALAKALRDPRKASPDPGEAG